MSTSVNRYVQELVLNVRVNHPVTIVYTDDPNETVALTKDAIPMIRDTTDKIYYWNPRLAWTDISDRNTSFAAQLANPKTVDVPQDYKKTPMGWCFAPKELLKGERPIFIMSLLSVQFKKDVMAVMQELRDFDYMVRNQQNPTYRLIVIANRSFEISNDYDNLFGVIHHELPTKEELHKLYSQDFLEDYIDKVLKSVYTGDFDQIRKEFTDLEEYCVNTLTGITERQARLILFKAVSANCTKRGTKVNEVDIQGFKKYIYEFKFKEIARSGILNLMEPVPLEEVGGFDNLKEWCLERKQAFTPEAKQRGIKTPKGMALVGPSGTGKSYIAKAVAGILGFPCIQLNLSSIFNKYVGESEANLEAEKVRIEAMAPCVVFIDEIDKIFAGGGMQGGDSGVTARVLGKLLTWIQETQAELFFVVTANRVNMIPAELLRKGRFDEVWCVTFPTAKERREILDIHLHKRGYNLANLSKVVAETHDFSSAELEHIVAESILKSFFRGEELIEDHLLEEVKKTNPIAIAFKDDIELMRAWADKNARPASKKEFEDVKLEGALV